MGKVFGQFWTNDSSETDKSPDFVSRTDRLRRLVRPKNGRLLFDSTGVRTAILMLGTLGSLSLNV